MIHKRTPTRYPKILGEWTRLQQQYLDEGLSKRLIYREIARDYGVSTHTVCLHLNPNQMQKHRDYCRNYARMRAEKKRRKKEYKELYRQKPENRAKIRNYDSAYHSITRHFYNHLCDIFLPEELLDLEKISSRLEKTTGIRFQRKTLQKYLARAPPEFEEVEPRVYRYRRGEIPSDLSRPPPQK